MFAVSYAVLRGSPSASQRYLDSRLEEIARGRPHTDVPLHELIYHCMREHRHDVHMINGASGEQFTNEQILRRAVPIARALSARGAKGKPIMCVMRNHEHLVSMYYGAMFAGVPLFLLDPLSTSGELKHFLILVNPCLVACDADRSEHVGAAVRKLGQLAEDDVLLHDRLYDFTAGYDEDPDRFSPVPVAADACALYLPTSGSTGLPKAAKIQLDGLLAHLPSLWTHMDRFPRPTERLMFMSTAQWMTFTNFLTACPVYRITVIISPDKTLPTVLRMIQTFKPTWFLLGPGTAVALSDSAAPGQLDSLQHMVVTGAAASAAALQRLKALAPAALVCNAYGMTEAQGFVSMADKNTPLLSIGRIFNIFEYKLVDEDGKVVPRGEKGELYLNSNCIIKSYLNNEEAYRECVAADGWWKTGDVFTEDQNNYLHFIERKKFWLKYLNYHISPEELEAVISKIDGVLEVVVASSEKGAAAAIVKTKGADVTREAIHSVVNKAFIEYKQLRGGIAFVDALPRTHSGKLHRADCSKLVHDLVERGDCF